MPDFPSWNDLFRIGRDEILARNSRISREAVEREGMDANVLIAAAAAMADEVVGQLTTLAASLFLDSADGELLDRLVFDRYGLTRKSASPSLGSVEFRTLVASPVTFTIPIGTVLQTASGVQFLTTESATFPVGSTGPIVVAVRSILAGASQNMRSGTITSITSAIPSQPADLTVNNTLATAGGDEVETDASLRDRARRFFTATRRATLAALETAALGVAGVQIAQVFEVLDATGRPARLAQLVVADAFTEQFASYDVVPPRYETQSALLARAVIDVLEDVRAAGIFVDVKVASVSLQPVQLALTFEATAATADTALRARSAVVNHINSLRPGGTLYLEDLRQRLRNVDGLFYTGQEILLPLGDVVSKPLQLIRTTLGIVTALSTQNDRPIVTGDNPDSYTLAAG